MTAYWVGTSWKMNKTLAEALAFAEALAAFVPGFDPAIQPFVIPPFTAVREVKAALADDARQGRRAEHALGRCRRLDRRDFAGDAEGLRARPGRTRPQRAPRAFRRDGRDRRTEDGGGGQARLVPLICVGETLAEREGGPRRCGADRAGAGRAARPRRTRADGAKSCSPTSRSGRSARRAFRPAPTMPTSSRR